MSRWVGGWAFGRGGPEILGAGLVHLSYVEKVVWIVVCETNLGNLWGNLVFLFVVYDLLHKLGELGVGEVGFLQVD